LWVPQMSFHSEAAASLPHQEDHLVLGTLIGARRVGAYDVSSAGTEANAASMASRS